MRRQLHREVEDLIFSITFFHEMITEHIILNETLLLLMILKLLISRYVTKLLQMYKSSYPNRSCAYFLSES